MDDEEARCNPQELCDYGHTGLGHARRGRVQWRRKGKMYNVSGSGGRTTDLAILFPTEDFSLVALLVSKCVLLLPRASRPLPADGMRDVRDAGSRG